MGWGFWRGAFDLGEFVLLLHTGEENLDEDVNIEVDVILHGLQDGCVHHFVCSSINQSINISIRSV